MGEKLRGCLLLVGLLALGIVLYGSVFAETGVLIAKKVAVSPIVDGDDSEAAWAAAEELALPNGATVKAVYTDAEITILAKWSDPTMSMVRGGSWSLDGSTWVKSSAVEEGAFNEDRFCVLWNINTTNFATMGCMTKCHGAQGDPTGAWLENVGEYEDMWHMKAARSLGAISASQSADVVVDPATHAVTAGTVTLNGYCDDKLVAAKEDPDYPFSDEDGGRHGDAGTSTYSNNRSEDKTAPKYMEKAPADYMDAMILRQEEVDNGEAVSVADLSSDEISKYWAIYDGLHAVVPERVLRSPEGSRADVREAGIWSNGFWTAEYQRALVTGNADDVQFGDLSKDYYFATTIMDNAGGDNHNLTDTVEILRFEAVTAVEVSSWGAIKSLFKGAIKSLLE